MGLLGGLFGTKYEPLDEGSENARAIEKFSDFAQFISTANDRVEVVPGTGDLYVFVGKPPKAFGFLWFDGTARHDVRSAMEQGMMTRDAAGKLVNKLTGIYESMAQVERFEHRIGGHKLIVAPSAEMYGALREALLGALS